MGVKGSKNFQNTYGYNSAEISNDYLVYRNPNPGYQMQIHQSMQALNGFPQKNSPIQSSSHLVSNSEVNNFEPEKSNIKSVRRKPDPSSPESSAYKSGKANQVSKSSLLQELLECPICMNLYDAPTVLPCQHTFCKRCIVSLKNNDTSLGNSSSTIICPICRSTHELPNGVEALTSNYTMKRLIELESMDSEKEKKNDKNAKCFVCQNYSLLKVCNDCSYMLCKECIQDPNHDIIIESKLHSKSKPNDRNRFATMVKSESRFNKLMYDYSERLEMYSSPKILIDEKIKLILLCHSAQIEQNSTTEYCSKFKNDLSESENNDSPRQPEIYEDEFGKCSTYSKISISSNDRLITLKKIVEKKFGINLEDQIIVYKDKILKNDLKVLSSFHLRQYSRIHIFDERDLKENFDAEEEIYGNYLKQKANNDASLEKKERKIDKDNVLPTTQRKEHISNEHTEKSRSQIKRDRSVYKIKPSKFTYENEPEKNYTNTMRRQNKYYSSVTNYRYVNNDQYSNF